MPSRREIREAVVQFLYCADLEGGADPAQLRGPFWDFLTESDRHALWTATAKTVRHLVHGRDERLAAFRDRLAKAVAWMARDAAADLLLDGLRRVEGLENRWSVAFEKVEAVLRGPDESAQADLLREELETLFATDRELSSAREGFLLLLEDFPALKGPLEPVVATVRRLQRISDRVRMVENPEEFPEESDLAKLRQSKTDLQELRRRADEIVDRLLAERSTIDELLAAAVENYAPERLDPVDRAILRLGCYELIRSDTPTKVAINEAIELAKRYGTTESSRFVNGVLDRIARQQV